MGCTRCRNSLQQKLSVLLGALCGLALVFWVTFSTADDVNGVLPSDYKGWEVFAAATFSLPVAILCSYLLRDTLKFSMMLATSVIGAILVVCFSVVVFRCFVTDVGTV